MSEFDFDAVLKKRLYGEFDAGSPEYGSLNPEKFAQVQGQTAGKVDALRYKAAQLDAAAKANANSFVTQLGLDQHGIAAQAVNLAASAYSGASRVAGDIAGFALGDLPALARDLSLSDEEMSAIARHKQNIATASDVELINRRKQAGSYSALERFDQATQDRQRSADIDASFDRSDTVHQGRRSELHADLGEGFDTAWDQVKQGTNALLDGDAAGTVDMAAGLAKLGAQAGKAAVSNPGAAAEYIAENAPQLAIGAFGAAGKAALLASNAGYASEHYQKGIAKYQAEHNGAQPPAEERQKMAAYAASLAVAEQVMDTSLLKSAKGAADAAIDTARTGFIQSMKNITKATAGGVAGEAVTEGYQTFAEGEAGLKPATAKDIYEGAVIGGIAGGGLAGGGRSIGEALKATPEHAAERKSDAAASLSKDKAQAAAIATGDVTELTDPKSPNYNPAKAIAALNGNSSLEGTTEEAKQANLAAATEIVATLEKQRETTQAAFDLGTPEAIANYKQQLEQAKAEGNAAKVELLEEQLVQDPKAQKRRQNQLDKLDRLLGSARDSLSQFSTSLSTSAAKDLDVGAQVAAINAPIDTNDATAVETRTKDIDKLINLSMAVPDRLSAASAAQLADNVNNGLSDSQRSYLRAFSEARVAENLLKTMGQVSQEIYSGGSGNVGIAQYRERIATALAAGNKAQAGQQLETLRKFQADHQAKAVTVAEAWEEGKGTQIVRTKDGQWVIAEKRRPRAELRKNGGLEVNTDKLVTETQTEADAITKALVELDAAYAVKYPKNPLNTRGAKNVKDVPQAQPAASNQPAAEQASQAVGGNVPTQAGDVPGAGRAAVEASGLSSDEDPALADEPTEIPAEESSEDSGVSDAVEDGADREPSEGQNQSTNTTDEPAVAPVATTPEVEGIPGNLSASLEKSQDGTSYGLRNLIADYFTQTASREGDSTQRPLVAVKDFLSTHWNKVGQYLSTDKQTKEQTDLLSYFKDVAGIFGARLQKNLAQRTREFYFEDLIQFFITEDGKKLDLEENLKTAMSYAAFSWVVENATRSSANTDEEINIILGRDEDTRVSYEERSKLLYVGTRQNVIANALGQRAVQALGFKATKDAPVDLMPKLESSLGAHIFKMLMDEGILQRTEVSAADMAALTGSSATSDKAAHQFLKLARDSKFNLNPKAEEMFKKNMNTHGVLDKLFSVESGLKEPSSTPIQFSQANTKGTKQSVPSKLKDDVQVQNNTASYVRGEMFDLVKHLDEDIALEMAGAEHVDADVSHKAKRSSRQAKNEGLMRELRNIKDFVGGMVDQVKDALYFEHTVWKQQRVGIATNMVNPQSSKIHRHLLYRKSWETKVEFADPQQMLNFSLRVAEGLGVKTDKMDMAAAIEAFGKIVADPNIQAAVETLQKRLAGEDLSRSDQEALMQAVKTGGENFHSLSSLMVLAQAKTAQEAGESSFTVRLMGEVDGVTNGPMLSHLLLGAGTSAKNLLGLLNRGGFYEQGNDHVNYNLWRGDVAKGNFDLYETTAGHMVTSIQKMMATGIDTKWVKMSPGTLVTVMDAIYGFTGTLAEDGRVLKAGRNIIKTPLTAMVFGSSVPSAVDSMADGFVDSIYSAIEDTANGKKGAQTVPDLLAHINLLVSQSGGSMLDSKMSISDLMEYEFSQEQIKALKKTFSNTVGAAVSETMNNDFAVYIEQRKQLNLAAQTAHALYDSVYTALRDEMVTELVASGKIAVNAKTGKPLHDLTQAQEAELRKRLRKMEPMLHTAYSKDSKSLGAGLAIAKSSRKLSTKETFEGNAKFATPFADNGAKTTKTRGYEQVSAGPGVAMTPMSTHSTDSYISHTAGSLSEILNVHDAHGTGLSGFEQTARNLNQATWNAMLSYSSAGEMQDALSRTVLGLAGLIKEGKLPQSVMDNLNKQLGKIADKHEIKASELTEMVMAGMKSSAYRADSMKLEVLSQLQSIDQYALQGGNYEVSEQDRASALALRAGLQRDLSSTEKEAIAAIEAAMSEKRTETSDKTEVTSSPAELLEEDPPVAKESVFGKVGSPASVNGDLVAFFEEKSKRTAAEVIRELMGLETNPAKKLLLEMLRKTMPQGLAIQLIRPGDTLPPEAMPLTESYGWFVDNTIYVLSAGFENSGLQTTEVLLHELVHGALAQVVQAEMDALAADPKYTSDALTLVKNLQALMDAAKSYAKQQGITEFDSALGDIHEFIAYGMTRKSFQRMLAQVSVPNMRVKGSSNSLITGWKAFINNMIGLLFTGSDKTKAEQAESALANLIENVTGLMNRSAEDNDYSTIGRSRIYTPTRFDKNGKPLSQDTAPDVDPVGVLNTYSTTDIYNALNAGDVSMQFGHQLIDLLGGIVDKLHGPFGSFKAAIMKDQALTPLDTWLKAMDTGLAPFASSVQSAPMVISQREAFVMDQVEATVRAAIDRNEVTSKTVYKELVKLYKEASEFLKPSDFASQEEYDFIFGVNLDAQGKSDHLARFAAFGLANEAFNKKLQRATKTDLRLARDGKTFAERLQILFEQVLEFFHGTITKTFGGQRADYKLNTLVSQLVDIEAKKRTMLARQGTGFHPVNWTGEQLKTGAEYARGKIVTGLNSNFVRNNSNVFVQAVGSVARTVANDQVDFVLNGIADMRDKAHKSKHGVIMGMLDDFKGPGKLLNRLALASTNQQRERRTVIAHTADFVLKAFSNGGRDLNKQAKSAISQVFLRTGLHNLLGPFNMGQIADLVGNSVSRDAAIKTLEDQLSAMELPDTMKQHFINKATYLAYFKVTGINRDQMLMMSAHNIARLYGTAYTKRITEAQAAQVQPIIEQLIALYAVGFVTQDHIDNAKEVLRTEAARTDGGGNGAEFTLALHKRLELESKTRLFRNQEALMVHGYIPEIYNPHTAVQVATRAQGEDLKNQGYSEVGPTDLDPADPERERKYLYVLKDGGLMPLRSGILSYTGKSAKGTTKHNGFMNVNTLDGLENAALQADINSMKSGALTKGLRPNPRTEKGSYMAPVLNPQGEIVNWRYLMQDKTKDTALERDNRFDKVLGMLAGSIYDKDTSTEVNTQAIEALKEAYDNDQATDGDSYVHVGPRSTDKDLREIWSMLPNETRDAIRATWGANGMYVRKDAVTVVFGYRKHSLAEMFQKDPDARGHLEKLFIAGMEHVLNLHARVNNRTISADDAERYAKRAAVAVMQGERLWQELVHEVKDIIVVKSGVVLLGNLWSNLSLLALSGVSFPDILKHHLVALRGATAFHNDNDRLAALQAQIDTGITNGQEASILREIAQLKDSLARNPVKELIDAGLMPTIAEDVVADDDIYSYKSYLVRKAETVTGEWNPALLGAAKQVFMAHDTKIYQGLRRLTQLSDFVGRYALYQHLTTRKDNPLSKEDAVFEASDAFVNYDIPMHKGMQYMDDMGVVMFMKYFIRVQRVIVRNFRDNPARVLLALLVQSFMDLGPIVLDSGWLHKIGNNPFSMGAFQLPATIDDLGTIRAAMALIPGGGGGTIPE